MPIPHPPLLWNPGQPRLLLHNLGLDQNPDWNWSGDLLVSTTACTVDGGHTAQHSGRDRSQTRPDQTTDQIRWTKNV
ncbi:hypothetical protein CDEST_06204 [Colletotrichum destructivum]|uniref:Uncharacterized protein n=1 Tax=Colletotrichum destructivum TaxID=34406 RepID=A0AAX4ICS3_9PEZI|nr:hypothetical protein CDEST_06204 [Colletotrichum destructivum]